MPTEKENDMIQELINFPNLLVGQLSLKYHDEFHGITENDYGANQDIINTHLLDLILILILLKKMIRLMIFLVTMFYLTLKKMKVMRQNYVISYMKGILKV